jgi:hypothetical protein
MFRRLGLLLALTVLVPGAGCGGSGNGPTDAGPRRPVVLNFEPHPVAAGESVTIFGSNLVGSATSVTIGGRAAPVLFTANGRLTVGVPLTMPAGSHEVVVTRDGVVGESIVRLTVETFLASGDYSGAVLTAVNTCPSGDPENSTPNLGLVVTEERPSARAVVDGRTLEGTATVSAGQVTVDVSAEEGDRGFRLQGEVFLNEEDHRVFSGGLVETRVEPDCEIHHTIQRARVGGP